MTQKTVHKKRRSKRQTVMGYHLPAPKLTAWGFLYGLGYFALPFLALMALLDVIAYGVWTTGFDKCYGLLCLL